MVIYLLSSKPAEGLVDLKRYFYWTFRTWLGPVTPNMQRRDINVLIRLSYTQHPRNTYARQVIRASLYTLDTRASLYTLDTRASLYTLDTRASISLHTRNTRQSKGLWINMNTKEIKQELASSNKTFLNFTTIFWSLIFHMSLPRLGYFSYKKGNLKFSHSKMWWKEESEKFSPS